MKLCPLYIPAHTSSPDRLQPTVTITGGKYSAYVKLNVLIKGVVWTFPPLKMIRMKRMYF